MKCAIHICMMLIVGLLVPVGAQAHDKPFHHVHPKKKVVVKKKKKKPEVVYEQEPQVVYVERERKPQPVGNSSFSIRAIGGTISGNKLGLSDYENSPVGGIGFALRGMVDRNWAVELSMDFLGGGQLDYYQSQVPIQLSFLHYFAPGSKLRPYIVGGGGVQFTNLQYGNGAYTFDMTEIVNHMGVGALVKIGKRVSLSTDLRAVGSWATLGNTLVLEGCAESGTCPPDAYVVSGDRFNVGAQFMAAFSYNF